MKMNWKTEKGNQIRLVVKMDKLDLTADGTKYGEETYKTVGKFELNGKECDAKFVTESMHHNYKDIINFRIDNSHEGTIIIPDEISETIWGEERKVEAKAFENSLEADRKYEEHYNKVMGLMNQ